jgi:hypothetical protein
MTDTVILVEIDLVSPAGGAVTLRFADRAIAPFPPTDPDKANLVWDDRLLDPPSLQRKLFDDLESLSPGLGVGVMTLANADRALDAYQNHAWGEIRVWRWTPGTAFSAATQILKGLSAAPGFAAQASAPGRVSVGLYDYRAEADIPLQGTNYAGTNGVGGVLYEGLADGIKGKPKPLAWGNLQDAHVPAPIVNPGVLAYQLHDGAENGSVQIFDRGDAAGFISDGDFAGGLFDAHVNAASHYCTDNGRGLVKINGSPVGTVAFGLKGDNAGGYVETVGPIAARVLAKAAVPGGRIGASVAGLAAAAAVGVWYGDSINVRDVLAELGRSAPAAILPGRTGVWEAIAFAPPALVADDTIPYDDVVNIEADDTAPDPAGEVRIGWGRVFTSYRSADLAPAIKNTATETRLTSNYRYTVAVDATAKARFPRTWRTVQIDTALRSEADAIALAATLKGLFGLRADGKPRRMWNVTLELTDQRLATTLGKTIALQYPAYGINDLFLLVGEELLRPKRNQVIWTLWG